MQELFITDDSFELCIHTFGDKSNPAVILIAGAAGQSILWDKNLCHNIANSGYFVIRFDNRDTGKSSAIIYEENPYTLKNLAEDIIFILNKFDIKKSHIVGMSMGGYVAQVLSILFPERILSLTFIMSTINSLSLRGIRKVNNLPSQNADVVKKIAYIYQTPRINLEDKIKSLTDIWQLFNGTSSKFPYDEFHELARESYSRAKSKNAVRNHRLAILNSAADRSELLKNISIPTLIIHGEADPIIHVNHAYYAKQIMPRSELIIIEKMGHILSSLFTNQIENELLEHFRKTTYYE